MYFADERAHKRAGRNIDEPHSSLKLMVRCKPAYSLPVACVGCKIQGSTKVMVSEAKVDVYPFEVDRYLRITPAATPPISRTSVA